MEERGSVLIVDDNVSLCRTLSFILGRKGYGATTAIDGSEAIERVRERPFDIIFMNIKMPVMDGVETYQRIKKITPGAAVVMMTAYAVEDLIQEALEEGAYACLYKPLDIEEALRLIDEITRARKST